MTQPRKTASDLSVELISKFRLKKNGSTKIEDWASISISKAEKVIAQALEQYLLQESGELVRALEKMKRISERRAELTMNEQDDLDYSKIATQALNNFRSRHDG